MRKLMLSLIIMLVLFILLPFPVQAEGVSLTSDVFPDDILRAYLAENADLDGNNILDEDEIEKCTDLDLYDSGVASLEGTEHLTSLIYINCGKNPLTKVPTTKWPQLQTLYCNELSLEALDVKCLPELDFLSCENNSLVSLDLHKNPKLILLNCSNNLLTELDVGNSPDLTDLTCGGNALTSLDLSKNTKLEWLSCSNNQYNATALSQFTGEFSCAAFSTTDIMPEPKRFSPGDTPTVRLFRAAERLSGSGESAIRAANKPEGRGPEAWT